MNQKFSVIFFLILPCLCYSITEKERKEVCEKIANDVAETYMGINNGHAKVRQLRLDEKKASANLTKAFDKKTRDEREIAI